MEVIIEDLVESIFPGTYVEDPPADHTKLGENSTVVETKASLAVAATRSNSAQDSPVRRD
jgi:hypothetical protein